MNTEANSTDAYTSLIGLLANHAAACAAMDILESRSTNAWLDIVDALQGDYTALQKRIDESSEAIKALAAAHPEWFAEKKSIKTPHGEVQSRSSTSIEAEDEALSIGRITFAIARAERRGRAEVVAYLRPLLRVNVEINKEACAALSPRELARFGLAEKHSETISVKPPSVKLSAGVKASAKRKPSAKEPAQVAA